jgi:Domain of unknown function (DUF5666)
MEALNRSDDPTTAVPPPAPGQSGRSVWHRPTVLVSAGLALSLGLAAGGYGIASATTQSGPSTSALSASSSTTTPSATKPAPKGRQRGGAFGRGGFAGHGGFGSHGGFGGRLGGGPGFFGAQPGGVVKSITSTSVTITGPTGKTVTVTTNSSTQYREGPVKVTRGALAVGEHVAVFSPVAMPVPSSGATPSTAASSTSHPATVIDIILPGISGEVVSVSGSTIVVQDNEGFWRTLDVSSGTVYESAGKTATESAVKKGELISASGKIASNHTTLEASAVAVLGTGGTSAPRAPGSVSFGAGSTWTVPPVPGPAGSALPQGGSLQ